MLPPEGGTTDQRSSDGLLAPRTRNGAENLFEWLRLRIRPQCGKGSGTKRRSGDRLGMLRAFPLSERAEMVEGDGMIRVTCEYCSRVYEIEPEGV